MTFTPPFKTKKQFDVTVRRLHAADVDAYRILRLHALQHAPTSFGSSFAEEQARPLAELAQSLGPAGDKLMFGAFVPAPLTGHTAVFTAPQIQPEAPPKAPPAPVLIGMVGLAQEVGLKTQHMAAVRSMAVHQSWQGQGVGRALLAHLLVCARAMPPLRLLTLKVTDGNASAIGLYASMGFTPYGRLAQALYADGVYYDDLLMALALTAETHPSVAA